MTETKKRELIELCQVKSPDTRFIVSRDGIRADVGENVSPCLFFAKVDRYLENGITMEEIADSLINAVEDMTPALIKEAASVKVDTSQIFPAVYPLKAIDIYKDAVIRVLPDLGLFEIVKQKTSFGKGKEGAFRITPKIMQEMGMTTDELFKAAEKNVVPTVKSVGAFIFGDEAADWHEESIEDYMLPGGLHFVSAKAADGAPDINGAGCALTSGIIPAVANHIGADLIVLPSSIHEVLILAYEEDADIDGMVNLVREVNGTVAPDERLSDDVFIYHRDNDRYERCG